MLKQAVNKHKPNGQGSVEGVLRPLPGASATMNSLSSRTTSSSSSSLPSNIGIKRTATGLAKTFSSYGSFEDQPQSTANSQSAPIVIDENSPVKSVAPQISSCEYFDEDDFDDDIDLDVEDPCTKTVSYPSLSQAQSLRSAASGTSSRTTTTTTTTNTTSKPLFYPTLPKQQPHDFRVSDQRPTGAATRDSGYHSATSTPLDANEPVRSSAPLPWSSSPAEHRLSPLKHSPSKTFKANQFMFKGEPESAPVSRKIEPVVSYPPPAPKRRTLPWPKNPSEQAHETSAPPAASARPREPHHVGTSTTSSSRRGATDTPASKKYPWNTSASAVKEQRNSLREANGTKKKMKMNDATEDAALEARAKRTKGTVASVFLSAEQQNVLDLVVERKKSVFFTGSAGTGKSVLLREIIATLRRKFLREPDRVAVTASTGLAACNIGGVTLHSFAGIGLGKEDVPELVKKIKRNQKAKQRWMRTKILVVDEISMVDGDLFDKLEAVARQIRNNGRPFGGIQLVITGDFFQLPPVPDQGRVAKFAFDASTWNTSVEHTIGLHHVFRQKDPVFAGMLNEMREGRLSQSSIKAFASLDRPMEFQDTIDATELFPTRNEVERANSTKMSQLVGEVRTFEARDGGSVTDKAQRDKLLSNCMAPELIHLKKGAQVMLIKNIDETLVNGSLGKVIGFMNEVTFDAYTGGESDEELSAAAAAASDPAASMKKRAEKRILDNLFGASSTTWPVVRFTLADGTTRDLLCQREPWKIELPNGEVQASRLQVPLILAWALSIHKAQGQTLERVKVDLGKVFEKGQAYVALSRATSMQGLQVLRFDARKVVAHEKVRTFYANLSRVESVERKDKGLGVLEKARAGKRTVRTNGVTADEYERGFAEGMN